MAASSRGHLYCSCHAAHCHPAGGSFRTAAPMQMIRKWSSDGPRGLHPTRFPGAAALPGFHDALLQFSGFFKSLSSFSCQRLSSIISRFFTFPLQELICFVLISSNRWMNCGPRSLSRCFTFQLALPRCLCPALWIDPLVL